MFQVFWENKPFRVLLFAFMAIFSHALYAQEHNIHARITSDVWETIAMIKHRVVDDYEYYPIFNEEIKRLDKKTVELSGYMVPIRQGMVHESFLLSVLPINQCFFCGKNGIPMMIEIKLKRPVKYTDQVITVKGILNLQEVNAALASSVFMTQAIIID
jgi:hypothetical protein